MAKESGLGARVFVDGFNVSGDVTSLKRIGGAHDELDDTGIDKSARERLLGTRDGEISTTSWFNPTAGQQHEVFSALPTADRIVSYFHRATAGATVANLVAKQINYDSERAANGALTFEVQALGQGFGLEWATAMTAGIRTDTTATNGTSVDFGTGSTAFGLQAYLHVFAFTGTSATIAIEESSDDGVGDAFAAVTGGSFGAQSAVGASRIATAAGLTVERYLRVVTTGTFSNAQFAVAIVRNATATVF
jgi:hypothetical protein